MTEHSYRPGSWIAVVGPTSAALVDPAMPADDLAALWDAVRSSAPIQVLLDLLGAAAPEPSDFGLVITDADQIRVLVRASVTAVVIDAAGEPRTFDSGAVSTRVEYVADDVRVVRLTRTGGRQRRVTYPVVCGVVAADLLDWRPAAEAIATPSPDEILIDGVPTIALADSEAAPAGDHDGYTVTRASVGELRTDANPPPMVQAVFCSEQHANPPQSQECRICGLPLDDEIEPVTVERPSLGSLHFSTGQVVELDRRAVIGRSPSVDRIAGDDVPQLVQVDSPEQDISRTHVEIRLEGWHVLLVDLDSVNGTVVTLPGLPPERPHPREPFPLAPGAVIDLAGEVTFRYEAPR